MKDYALHIFYSEEDAGYIATYPDLHGCSAFGPTQEEALAELLVAREAWLAAARKHGIPIPKPRYRPEPATS